MDDERTTLSFGPDLAGILPSFLGAETNDGRCL
ncbi:hypothetical protein J2S55_000917 [Streptosporangium brasiliense]|uniref:Uncharacterized protein n=1 Tax=Streptosporangium brasiliense TaxID=47480 RepID=A0ABT9QXE4_9ACTN|nr:hypothetical protein [Streptosporangium brasiliense]